MRHDRTGELIEDDDTEPARPHPRGCTGWIDRNADRPVPCLVCKPHLAPTVKKRPREEASR